MKIVTGYRGATHIEPNDVQGLNQGIFGTGNYVLDVGNKFEAVLSSTNTLSIQDGEGVMQGVHFRTLPGTVDEVTLTNGVSGYQRIDLVCARYTKNSVTGVESVDWVVIDGTPDASSASIPTYTDGDILGGDLLSDFPMFRIDWNGITPTLTTLFTPHSGVPQIVYDSGDVSSVSPGNLWVQLNVPNLSAGVYAFSVYADGQSANNGAIHIQVSQTSGYPQYAGESGESLNDHASVGGFCVLTEGSAINITIATIDETNITVSYRAVVMRIA